MLLATLAEAASTGESSSLYVLLLGAVWIIREAGGWLYTRAKVRQQDAETKVADARETQTLRQSDQSFLNEQFRKFIAWQGKQLEAAQDGVDKLRASYSQESHALREDLQQAVVDAELCKDRYKRLEQEHVILQARFDNVQGYRDERDVDREP